MSNLPSVMRKLQSRFRFDPGYLVVLAIVILVLWPFLSRASLPSETDAELHIFRLAELSSLVQGGEFYPRWAPDFYHGYGYPIFNYYAPLTYYLGVPITLLPGLDAVDGVKFVFVLGLLGAAFGMYGFVRDNWGRAAGYVATAVYLYAPYVQYIDPHARGVLPESFSLGMFPLALWALDRLRRERTAWRVGTAVIFVAALVLSHNLMGMFFFGVLLAWAGWQVASSKFTSGKWRVKDAQTRRLANAPFDALFLGFLLAAFFWLPVLLERNAVNLTTLIGAGDNYDFRTHFLSWAELLAVTHRLDWGATEPFFAFNLGVAQWMLGGLGVIMLLLRRTRRMAQVAFFALSAFFLLFMMLPVSTFVWDAIPILPYFQFPWRLLGAAVAVLAILAGAGLAALLDVGRNWSGRVRAGVTAVAVALPILLGLPLTQPAPWPDFGEPSLLRMSLIEHTGRWLGTTSTADYVPVTVEVIPARRGNVVRGFDTNEPLDRVNRPTLPEEVSVVSTELSPLHFHYDVMAPRAFLLRLFLFDYPGWTVRVDGEVVDTELARPEGFIVVPVSAGEHVVDVRFADTPARTLAWVISGMALLMTAVVAWQSRRSRLESDQRHGLLVTVDRLQMTDWVVLTAVIVITAVTLFILNPLGVLHLQSTGYVAELAETAVFADFDGQIALIGYDTNATQAQSGDTLQVNLYWKAQQPQDINYRVFVHVLAPDGYLSAQSDKLNPGDFPTRRWPLDKYVLDDYTISLPMGLAPGSYTVMAGLWDAASGQRLPVQDADGTFVGDHFPLFTLEINELEEK
ncbi:MAG: hypothetical protein H6662_09770 [Ardenticatenaceae bacterium]|nr:hypothetical protein [Ardenticatenaceae bacterium]MCB8990981.1 hypothetical protein [Ardenticatenaceae bacterium]MCB9005339.1 hypothetical protein [Ardenticatenaceae bacterium]